MSDERTEAIRYLAAAVRELGVNGAATPQGAIELLIGHVEELIGAVNRLSDSVQDLADRSAPEA